jgi:hypothetical protein
MSGGGKNRIMIYGPKDCSQNRMRPTGRPPRGRIVYRSEVSEITLLCFGVSRAMSAKECSAMPIRFFLEPDHAFSPDEVKILVDAFEDTLRALNLTDRDDPLTNRVAKVIIGLAKDGERDPTRLRDLTLKFVRPESGYARVG